VAAVGPVLVAVVSVLNTVAKPVNSALSDEDMPPQMSMPGGGFLAAVRAATKEHRHSETDRLVQRWVLPYLQDFIGADRERETAAKQKGERERESLQSSTPLEMLAHVLCPVPGIDLLRRGWVEAQCRRRAKVSRCTGERGLAFQHQWALAQLHRLTVLLDVEQPGVPASRLCFYPLVDSIMPYWLDALSTSEAQDRYG
ncbi:hypothetical protein KIPB_010794, partial [Kipferlia bialata]